MVPGSRLKRHPWEPIPLTSRLLCFDATSAAFDVAARARRANLFVQIKQLRVICQNTSCWVIAPLNIRTHGTHYMVDGCFANRKCLRVDACFVVPWNARSICVEGGSGKAGNQLSVINRCVGWKGNKVNTIDSEVLGLLNYKIESYNSVDSVVLFIFSRFIKFSSWVLPSTYKIMIVNHQQITGLYFDVNIVIPGSFCWT